VVLQKGVPFSEVGVVTTTSKERNAMKAFLQMFASLVLGVLHGYDRLVLRGSLRSLCYPDGMVRYLSGRAVKFVDFAAYSQRLTRTILDTAQEDARRAGRPFLYLSSAATRKEDVARAIAERDQIGTGLICVLRCVEPCLSFELHKNRQTKHLELRSATRKCLHLYHYYRHPLFGFLHVRVQTWFPFGVRVCLNGREWLARQMDQEGLGYQRRDNCFTWLEDLPRAQQLCEGQLQVDWPGSLNEVLGQAHPTHPELLGVPLDYYWSVYQSEFASDVMFRCRKDLEALYFPLVRHAITTYRSADVMRFLGRHVTQAGEVHGKFQGEVVSDLGRRVEGLRVKHRVNENSLKMYDKGTVLRIETTINRPEEFKVYRAKEGEAESKKAWLPLRRGVADLQRRAQVSQASNERYAESLASVGATESVRELTQQVCRRAPEPGTAGRRRVRGLNPLAGEDAALLEAVSRPEFAVNGLRNRDLVGLLYKGQARSAQEKRRRSARVTRQIRLLRAHGLLKKVGKSHRYQVTEKGRRILTALLAVRDASVAALAANAA
jgi:hypothetical protein